MNINLARAALKNPRLAAITLVAPLLLTVGLVAAEKEALPDLQLAALDGTAVTTPDLPQNGAWLLIYVFPTSRTCGEFLKTLTSADYPGLAAKTVIVVGGTGEAASKMKANYPELSQASWYVDSSRSTYNALKLRGIPMVLGIEGQTISWGLKGNLRDEAVSKSIMNSWIRR